MPDVRLYNRLQVGKVGNSRLRRLDVRGRNPRLENDTTPLTIIVIDDVEGDLRLLERTIKQSKLLNLVKSFHTGESALDYLRQMKEKKSVEAFLLFVDVVMPPLDGIEVLTAIQHEDLAPKSIFVMVSGLNEIKHVTDAYQIGAKTFLLKPIKVEDVASVVTSLAPQIEAERTEDGYWLHWTTHH